MSSLEGKMKSLSFSDCPPKSSKKKKRLRERVDHGPKTGCSDSDQDRTSTTSKNSKTPVMRKIIPDTTKPYEDFFHDPKHWRKVTTQELYEGQRESRELLLKYEQPEHIAKFALSDYNKKHGTHLEYVRLLDGRENLSFFGYGSHTNLLQGPDLWNHLNFEARRYNADQGYESLLLFAEVYTPTPWSFYLTTLSLVDLADKSNGCQACSDNICHPRNGFRADALAAVDKHELPEDDASSLSKLALEQYNKQNGTHLVFVRALQCNKFTSVGLLMDFTKKDTIWVHVNFKARVRKGVKIRMFAELYLGDDGTFVLATLSPTKPPTKTMLRQEKEKSGIQRCCCPPRMHHPWRGFRYGFNSRPGPNFLPPVEVASCEPEPHAAE